MCGSMVDIQSPTAENRREKKKKKKTTAAKYTVRMLCRAAKIINDNSNNVLEQSHQVKTALLQDIS